MTELLGVDLEVYIFGNLRASVLLFVVLLQRRAKMKEPKRLTEMSEEERIKQSDKYVVAEAERRRLEDIMKKKKERKPEYCEICGLPRDLCICEELKFRVPTEGRENE